MNILMLSWEYPPLNHGGLSRHVYDLSQALARRGHTIHIVTTGNEKLDSYNKKGGVHVHRTSPVKIDARDFLQDINHLNYQLTTTAIEVIQEYGVFDLVHGHDWLVFWAGKILKHGYKIPLVFTIHATEFGRNNGIHTETQQIINDIEWYACYEAWKIITCSNYMKEEVKRIFQLPEDKIKVIRNGVNPEEFQTEVEEEFRSKYAHSNEKLIFYVGRLVREKGVQYLLQALAIALHDCPELKLVISGKGPYENKLKERAKELGIEDRVYFTGFISDEERNKLYQTADIAVFPSLYEPFGIVALEAMAARIPLITSNAGGLDEVIENGRNAIKVSPGDAYQLTGALLRILHDQQWAEKMAKRAFEEVITDYNWNSIADKTCQFYRNILGEYYQSGWNINRRSREEKFTYG